MNISENMCEWLQTTILKSHVLLNCKYNTYFGNINDCKYTKYVAKINDYRTLVTFCKIKMIAKIINISKHWIPTTKYKYRIISNDCKYNKYFITLNDHAYNAYSTKVEWFDI